MAVSQKKCGRDFLDLAALPAADTVLKDLEAPGIADADTVKARGAWSRLCMRSSMSTVFQSDYANVYATYVVCTLNV